MSEKFMPNEQCYVVFVPTFLYPLGDIIGHLYHFGLKDVEDEGLIFKTKEEARVFLANFKKAKPLTENERLLFTALKETIEDLELRAKVHKTLTDEEMVVPMSDSRYRKAKDVIEKFERVQL